MSSATATMEMRLTLKFSNDLPNGYYAEKVAETSYNIFISQQATVQDVKQTMENKARSILDAQMGQTASVTMPIHGTVNVKKNATWEINKIMYKGGEVLWDTPLSKMNNDDVLSCLVTQRISTTVTRTGGLCCVML